MSWISQNYWIIVVALVVIALIIWFIRKRKPKEDFNFYEPTLQPYVLPFNPDEIPMQGEARPIQNQTKSKQQEALDYFPQLKKEQDELERAQQKLRDTMDKLRPKGAEPASKNMPKTIQEKREEHEQNFYARQFSPRNNLTPQVIEEKKGMPKIVWIIIALALLAFIALVILFGRGVFLDKFKDFNNLICGNVTNTNSCPPDTNTCNPTLICNSTNLNLNVSSPTCNCVWSNHS